MSRAWMPWFIGDYLRDTAHLTTEQHGAYMLLLGHCWQHGAIPADDQGRAAVARLPLNRWHSHSQTILAFFQDDGTHKRVTKELERAEVVSVKRKMAGAKGGFHSAIAKAKAQPKPKQMLQQNPSNYSSNRIDNHNHNKNLTSTESQKGEDKSARSLATALPTGALAREPCAENGDSTKAVRGVFETLEDVCRRKGWVEAK